MSQYPNFNRSNSTSTYSETMAIINHANDINQNNLNNRNHNTRSSMDQVNGGGTATDSSKNSNSCDDLSSLKKMNESKKSSNGRLTNGANGNGYVSLIEKINERIRNNQTWFSLEFFPPKTINGAANLISK